jgi:hypothetical protein
MEKTAIFIVLAGSRWPVVASRMSDWGQQPTVNDQWPPTTPRPCPYRARASPRAASALSSTGAAVAAATTGA